MCVWLCVYNMWVLEENLNCFSNVSPTLISEINLELAKHASKVSGQGSPGIPATEPDLFFFNHLCSGNWSRVLVARQVLYSLSQLPIPRCMMLGVCQHLRTLTSSFMNGAWSLSSHLFGSLEIVSFSCRKRQAQLTFLDLPLPAPHMH